ncbi:unnamed protein product [Phytophthora fragariaefolia]|uniref:Unnamed protein product n=1 Tax=Phytophthora fragariaefolia TaxID=1490495 RepID=A0A9W6YIQ6_9STRA|nr:unnamed protein product [Phytophthora fragariaefolia]
MMAEGDGVLEHINKIKTLAEQLDAVGAPVSEDDLEITLLASLNESYQFLITALESRADSLTWELVTARLLHEDFEEGRLGILHLETCLRHRRGLERGEGRHLRG